MPEVEKQAGGPREVILRGDLAQRLDDLTKKYPRIDQVYRGLAWRLARQPTAGTLMPLAAILGGDAPVVEIRVVRSRGLAGLAELVILYKFDAHTVTILDLRVAPTPL